MLVTNTFDTGSIRDLDKSLDFLKALPDKSPTEKRASLCIVTQDFSGPILNGGIGTIYTALARVLAENSIDVTVLFTLGERSEKKSFQHWQDYYHKQNIKLVAMPEPSISNNNTNAPFKRAYAVYEWLKDKHFDFVHSPDWMGQLFYCLQAKDQGIAFFDTCFVVGCHGPSLWNWQGNRQIPDNIDVFTYHDMERKCAELTDYLVSSSHHLVEWMLEEGWQISPDRTFVQPNIFINPWENLNTYKPGSHIREIVFCGRLEFRKGIHIFCDAINKIQDQLGGDITVTIIGKPVERKDFRSVPFIKGKLKDLKLNFNLHTDFDSEKLISYFTTGDKLAVIASTGDNSPITITEFLNNGVPFIASTTGGLPELIHQEDWDRVLFPATANGLAKKLLEVVGKEAYLPRSAIPTEHSNSSWIDWHHTLYRKQPYAKKVLSPQNYRIGPDDITVCLIHHERPSELDQALAAIEKQTVQGFKVIVVDDGSSKPETLAYLDALGSRLAKKDWQLIRQENLYAGAARNTAARNVKTSHIVFMDDDNVAKYDELEQMLVAINNSGADALTSFADVFEENWLGPDMQPLRRLIFSGGIISNSLWVNTIGDANMIISKEVFDKVGGFHEKFGTGYEDYQFLVRVVLEGFRIDVIPEPTYWYKISKNRVRERHYSVDDAKLMVLDSYLAKIPVVLRPNYYSAYARGFTYTRGFSIRTEGRVVAQDGTHSPKWAKAIYRVQKDAFHGFIGFQNRIINWEFRAYERFIHFQAAVFLHVKEMLKKLKGK